MIHHTPFQALLSMPKVSPGSIRAFTARGKIAHSMALAFVLALVIAGAPFAETEAAEPTRVVYGFDREFPPFTYEAPGGQPTGFEIELMQAVFHDTGAVLVFRPLQWERIGLELSAGTVSLTTGMVRTEQRSKLYLFSDQPTFPLQIRLFTKIYNRFPSAALLRGQTVAVERGSYQHRLLDRFGGTNIKPYQGRTEGLRALYRDEVTAYCGPVQSTYFYINKLDYGAITTVGTPLGITEMRVAINRERGDIQRMVNEGLARVKASGEYERLYRKWFVRDLAPQEREVMRSAAVKAAIPAYVPYGKQGQGAAVLTATGKVYSACTVENADLALSLSALRGAVSRAIADGEFELRAAVIVDSKGKIQPPSAEELQVLYEFGRGVLLLQEENPDSHTTRMVAELLPDPVVRETGLIQTE